MILETWIAEELRGVMGAGRTQPLALSCRPMADPNARAREFVVKARGLPEVYEGMLYAEVFGNLLARELHVPTPEPALVEIPAELIPLLRLGLQEHGRQECPKPGLAAGCARLGPGFSVPTTHVSLKSTEIEDAAFIYAFDMAVQNPDRRVENPNCLSDGAHFYAIDFEKCFAFTLDLPFVKFPPPWQVSQIQLFPRQGHLFRSTLAATGVDWAPVEAAYSAITHERLKNLTLSVPSAWKSHESRIFTHLLGLAENSAAFIDELRRTLS